MLVLIGSDKSCILMVMIYIIDFVNVECLNVVWDNWFDEGMVLSCVCVKVELVDFDWLVEMVFIVVVGEDYLF